MFYDKPIFFEKNRVYRVYTGGKLFAGFFGDNSEDSFYPEEWVASPVKAMNKDSSGWKKIRLCFLTDARPPGRWCVIRAALAL